MPMSHAGSVLPSDNDRMPTIDTHAHMYHPDYLTELEGILRDSHSPIDAATMGLGARVSRDPAMFRPDDRLEIMDRIGLDYQVLSLSIPFSYAGNAATRLKLAQTSNDHFAEVIAKHPKRFYGFATLPLPDVDASLTELRRCLDELGMLGAVFGSNIRGEMRLDAPEFASIFEELNRRGSVAFLHPNTPICSGPDLSDFNLTSGLGYIFDTGVTVYRMIFSGFLERYRNLKVILPHLGGMLPVLLGRIEGNYKRHPNCQGIPKAPGEYMRELYYDTVSFHAPALRLCAEMFGADHLLLGSDYPLGGGTLEEAYRFVADFGFTPTERDQVLGGNAARVLGLSS
jgi:aminocarboxymuconate-semialdehyde decarboxylase